MLGSSGAKALTVPGKSTVMVPGFGAPAPKENEPLAEAPANLRLRLREAAAPGQELDSQPLEPSILAPEEYVEVKQAQFVPALDGQPNQLTVTPPGAPPDDRPSLPGRTDPPQGSDALPHAQGPAAGQLVGDAGAGQGAEADGGTTHIRAGERRDRASSRSASMVSSEPSGSGPAWSSREECRKRSRSASPRESASAPNGSSRPASPPSSGSPSRSTRSRPTRRWRSPSAGPGQEFVTDLSFPPRPAQEAAHRLRPPRRGRCAPVRSVRRRLGRDLRRSRHPGQAPGLGVPP